jgi:predicted RNase H-like HicB family nuclease
MSLKFNLEYWMDDDWYVGRLGEVAGVFSQGETLRELQENIRDAYRLMVQEQLPLGTLRSRNKSAR